MKDCRQAQRLRDTRSGDAVCGASLAIARREIPPDPHEKCLKRVIAGVHGLPKVLGSAPGVDFTETGKSAVCGDSTLVTISRKCGHFSHPGDLFPSEVIAGTNALLAPVTLLAGGRALAMRGRGGTLRVGLRGRRFPPGRLDFCGGVLLMSGVAHRGSSGSLVSAL